MAHYVVSIFSHMDGDNRTFLIEASNDADAAKQTILAHCPQKYRDTKYKAWVAGLGEDFNTVANGAAQGGLVLSTPLEPNSLLTLSKANYKPAN